MPMPDAGVVGAQTPRQRVTPKPWSCILFLAVAAASMLWSDVAWAQSPGAVSGVVRDAAGRPIDHALVALDPNTSDQRITQTDSTGRFQFTAVRAGAHELVVAFAGYRSVIRNIDVPAEGLDVAITLEQSVMAIDTLRIEARRTGILGTVIAHEDFRALADADVHIIGQTRAVRTGADGQFAFPQVAQGNQVVYAKRKGYVGRMLSVMVPRDSAIEVAMLLDAERGDSEKRFNQLLREFDNRRRWMTGSNAALVSRHELAGREGMSLWDALSYSPTFMLKGLRLDDQTCIYVDGQFKSAMTAKDISMAEIEAVEVYGTGADYTGTVTARHGTAPSRLPVGGMCGNSPPRSLQTGRKLDDRMMGFGQGPRSNRNRVEAIVIWRRR